MYVPGCALSCIYAPFYSMTVAIPAAFRQLSEQARQAQSEREKKKTWPCIHAKIYTGRDMLSAKKELFDFKAGEKNMLIITLETVCSAISSFKAIVLWDKQEKFLSILLFHCLVSDNKQSMNTSTHISPISGDLFSGSWEFSMLLSLQ